MVDGWRHVEEGKCIEHCIYDEQAITKVMESCVEYTVSTLPKRPGVNLEDNSNTGNNVCLTTWFSLENLNSILCKTLIILFYYRRTQTRQITTSKSKMSQVATLPRFQSNGVPKCASDGGYRRPANDVQSKFSQGRASSLPNQINPFDRAAGRKFVCCH